MTEIKDLMSQKMEQMGKNVDFEGLMSQKARIKNSVGKTAKDVLGWDYLMRGKDGICYSFYAAQPPLIGMTQPIPVPCPLGIRTFAHYNVDFSQAIDILQKMNCGDSFVAMELYWPLTPECREPFWFIKTSIGSQVVIGANSGKPECHKA